MSRVLFKTGVEMEAGQWDAQCDMLRALLRRTTEAELLKIAGGRVDWVKEAIREYNHWEEHGWPAELLMHLHGFMVPAAVYGKQVTRDGDVLP